MFVNYEGSILSYIASIRRYFGLTSSYGSDPRLSKLLEEQRPGKVFVLLVDAMGTNLIRQKLPEDAFLRRNMLATTTTVFPSTTTAATTSIRNGKAHIIRRKCVRCYCCQEFCPTGAMRVKRSLPARIAEH